jgi:hypothetical protein
MRPLPVVPLPFEEEAFGGWLERVAWQDRLTLSSFWSKAELGVGGDNHLVRPAILLDAVHRSLPEISRVWLAAMSACWGRADRAAGRSRTR